MGAVGEENVNIVQDRSGELSVPGLNQSGGTIRHFLFLFNESANQRGTVARLGGSNGP